MSVSIEQATHLIWREAALLDALDYEPWLDMWTDDGFYIVPIERDAPDYAATLNIVYDDAAMRAARVKRLQSGFSSSSAPPARTVRTVSRFVFEEGDEGVLIVHAAQMLAEYKYERLRMMPADVVYEIVKREGVCRLHRKIVHLANAQDAQQGIGYLL